MNLIKHLAQQVGSTGSSLTNSSSGMAVNLNTANKGIVASHTEQIESVALMPF